MGSVNADLKFAGRFNTDLKLRSKQPQVTDQYVDLSFNVSVQCIPLGNLLVEPSLDLSSRSTFRLGASMKHSLPNSFCWKTVLTPTEVSTNLEVPAGPWKSLVDFMPFPAPGGEAWLAHGLEYGSEPSFSWHPESLSLHLLLHDVNARQSSHPLQRVAGL